MKICSIGLLALVLTISSTVFAGHPKPNPATGWKSLFDGETLSGWTQRNPSTWSEVTASWNVEDGAIARTGKGYLVSNEQFDNFVLDLEFRVDKGTNSGVFLRHLFEPGVKPYWKSGVLEVQVSNSNGNKRPTVHDCGSLFDMVAPIENHVKPTGEWNRMTITADNSVIEIVLNGSKILTANLEDWTEAGVNPDGTPCKYTRAMRTMRPKGHLMLQDHGTPVWFRNIWVRELEASPQLN